MRLAGTSVPETADVLNQLANGNRLDGRYGARLDAADDRERFRHERVFEIQGNRNPFIDRPEFALTIWGDECSG